MSEPRPSSRIPSLDGLRAFSIVLVTFSHLLGTMQFPLATRDVHAVGDVGTLGVRVFFVISGFLITSLLIHEHRRTGTVSLTSFYVRRAFRIFPAFYAFILAMVVADQLGAIDLHLPDVLHAATYTTNYHYDRSWELGHIWSLSVEEQFYVLWPAMFLLAGRKHLGKVAVAMVIAAPVFRVIAWFTMPSRDDVIFEAYPCVMDAIAIGCVLACARPRLDASRAYQRFLRSPWFLIVPAIVVWSNLEGWFAIDYFLKISIQNIALALIVDRCVRVTRGPVFELLNARAVVWVGTMSYSIYLWQEPFLNHYAHSGMTTWPVNLMLALICAVASFYLVETPFFAIRDQWAARRKAKRASAAAREGDHLAVDRGRFASLHPQLVPAPELEPRELVRRDLEHEPARPVVRERHDVAP